MKRIVILLMLSTLFSILTRAQTIAIESFSIANGDVSASTQGRLDSNGDACGLIKVFLPTSKARFNGNVVGNTEQHTSTYWVYMSPGSKRLQVEHPDYPQLDVIFKDFGIASIQAKTTYKLVLSTPQSANNQNQTLKIKHSPYDAIVLIDGDIVETSEGQTTLNLPIGNHSYNITAKGYIKQQGEIKLTADAPGKLIVELDKLETNAQTKTELSQDKTNNQESIDLISALNRITKQKEDSLNLARQIENAKTDYEAMQEMDSVSLDFFKIKHEAVDLGLSVKWATCNIGAMTPSDFGNYYAWGETKTKTDYSESNYKYRGDKKTLSQDNDAAYINWGKNWRMPTNKEFKELYDECVWTWTYLDGKQGYLIKSKKNGNSIFLPAAGYYGSTPTFSNEYGYYWSSPFVQRPTTWTSYRISHPTKGYERYLGRSIRPVTDK